MFLCGRRSVFLDERHSIHYTLQTECTKECGDKAKSKLLLQGNRLGILLYMDYFLAKRAHATILRSIIIIAVAASAACLAPGGIYAQSPSVQDTPLPSTTPELPPSPVFTSSETIVLPKRVALIPQIPVFTVSLKRGDQGDEVRNLQRFLNQHGFLLSMDGPGSPGLETVYFGPLTEGALVRYQQAYAAYVLSPEGLTEPSGVFGPRSLSYANQLMQHGFVNLFPAEKTPSTNTNETQIAGVGGTLQSNDAIASFLTIIKQQVESVAQKISSLSAH
jgi:peptidoglycan hydrolase-like protein with peptidoglycan-binding domain